MGRFIFYTDPQLSGQTPSHRVDNYPQALVNKIAEIYQAAVDEKCDYLICGGDFFNSHRIYSYELFNALKDIIDGVDIPTYMIIGQHDLFGYNKGTYKSSALAFAVKHWVNMNIIWEPVDLGDVVLHASHVWEDPYESKEREVDESKFNILVAHHLFTDQDFFFEVVKTFEYAPSPYNLVLTGDLHTGYAPHEVEGTWFVNPGAVARQAINETKRIPKYAVIDVVSSSECKIKEVIIKCVTSGDEAFGETIAEIARAHDGFDPTKFIENIEKFEMESVDVHELVQNVGRSEGIEKDVLDYLFEKKS